LLDRIESDASRFPASTAAFFCGSPKPAHAASAAWAASRSSTKCPMCLVGEGAVSGGSGRATCGDANTHFRFPSCWISTTHFLLVLCHDTWRNLDDPLLAVATAEMAEVETARGAGRGLLLPSTGGGGPRARGLAAAAPASKSMADRSGSGAGEALFFSCRVDEVLACGAAGGGAWHTSLWLSRSFRWQVREHHDGDRHVLHAMRGTSPQPRPQAEHDAGASTAAAGFIGEPVFGGWGSGSGERRDGAGDGAGHWRKRPRQKKCWRLAGSRNCNPRHDDILLGQN